MHDENTSLHEKGEKVNASFEDRNAKRRNRMADE